VPGRNGVRGRADRVSLKERLVFFRIKATHACMPDPIGYGGGMPLARQPPALFANLRAGAR